MMDFNFLRIKWPKLAAIAADASRLVEVSPSSSVATMQTFCEWATDIALDLYAIKWENGTTQQQKMETLRSTGNVPTEILTRMNNIMMSGGSRIYHVHEDVEEARRCIDDVYEIARWLNREADRAGMPRANVYRSPMSQAQSSPYAASGNSADSRLFPGELGGSSAPILRFVLVGVGAVAIIVLLVLGISALVRNISRDVVTIPSTPPATSAGAVLEIPTDTPAAPTPTPEVEVFLDTLEPADAPSKGFYRERWKEDKPLTIGDKAYENGIGWFIPSRDISDSSASKSAKYDLGGKYSVLRFDLGVDANMDYGEGYGTFRLVIYVDEDVAYDSERQEYNYTEFGTEVDLGNCDEMKIVLTQKKGSKGTINVVIGDMRLVQTNGAPDDAASSTGPVESDAEESPEPDESAGTEGDDEDTSGEPA